MTKTPNTFKVLLVDDDEEDYLIVRSIISRITDLSFSLDWISTFDEATVELSNNEYDIYLIDYRLGSRSGLELLDMAKPYERAEPFIILTGAGDHDIEHQAMNLGAADYLIKGSFDQELLSRTLRYAMQRKQIEQQRIEHLLELNRAKDEFISLASHQLRTPATGVKQYVGMLLEGFVGDLEPRQKKMLEQAYQSNERQLRIVSDLLKVAQVDAGKVILRKQPTKINEMIRDIISEQDSSYSTRQQIIKFTPLQSECMANIDHDTIRMALENIIDNASKYSPPGSQVEIESQENGNEIKICIQDHGVGIKKQDQIHLFQKFSRVDNALSMKVGGTGLGLYWAKKIIDLHDGDISFTSKYNEGTTFVIRLPIK